jgi:RCC1 and BTB domain-containing protein
VFSFGFGEKGQLGTGSIRVEIEPQPVEVIDKMRLISISAGWTHSMAVNHKHEVFVWGSSDHGALGTFHSKMHPVPFHLGMLNDWKIDQVACGRAHSLFLSTQNDEVYSVGCCEFGQLGVPNQEDQTQIEQISRIDTLRKKKVKSIKAGLDHSGALLEDGTAYMWGYNYDGQLGVATCEEEHLPRLLDSMASRKIIDLQLGLDFTVLLTGSRDIWFCQYSHIFND